MVYKLLKFLSENDDITMLLIITFFFALSIYIPFSIRNKKIINKQKNKQKNELSDINAAMSNVCAMLIDLQNQVAKIILETKKKTDPYYVLSTTHQNEINFYKNNKDYKNIYTDEYIDFLFEKTKLLIYITNYFYNVDFMNIKIDVIMSELNRTRSLITDAANKISEIFAVLNRYENEMIFRNAMRDILEILNDKINNDKKERLLKTINKLLKDTIFASNIAYRNYLNPKDQKIKPKIEFNSEIDRLIAEGDPMSACFEILKNYPDSNDYILQLLARINMIESSHLKGIITDSEYKIEFAKITDALINRNF